MQTGDVEQLVDPDKALDYIRKNGDRIAQARLGYLLNNQPPGREEISALLAGQRADGGWPPFWATDYSSLDATCFRLAQVEQVGLSVGDSPVARAARFLARRQEKDGSWEEDKAHTLAAPAWVKPGRRAARLYLTANCGFWLAITTQAQPGVIRTARYLLESLTEQGELPAYLQAHWLAAGIWIRLGWLEPVERVLGYLGQRLANLPPSNLTWMGLTLSIAGISEHHELIEKILSLLESSQRADGAWSGEEGTRSGDVHTTLEALRVLRFGGRF